MTLDHFSPRVVPLDVQDYWLNGTLVPNDIDFYPQFRITKVSIRIFIHSHYIALTQDEPQYYTLVQKAYVKLKNHEYYQEAGLHLFPVRRLKLQKYCYSMKFIDKNRVKTSILLPLSIKENILKVMNEGRPSRDFTCVQFVNYIYDLYVDDGFDLSKYYIRPWRPNSIDVGASVLLSDEGNHALHAALYIGNSLYLWMRSVHCFHVTTLESMETTYKSHHTYIITPKNNAHM